MPQPGKGKSRSRRKGFAAMSKERRQAISSKGGRASAQSDTSNRGFASMEKKKQRELSRRGGKASRRPKAQKPDSGLPASNT